MCLDSARSPVLRVVHLSWTGLLTALCRGMTLSCTRGAARRVPIVEYNCTDHLLLSMHTACSVRHKRGLAYSKQKVAGNPLL